MIYFLANEEVVSSTLMPKSNWQVGFLLQVDWEVEGRGGMRQ